MKVKLCGITRAEDALFCARMGADMVGFIFYARSVRAITPAAARIIIDGLPPGVTPVGVFVNASRAEIGAAVLASGVRMIQLSGDETPEECRGHGVGVIKAFRFRSAADAPRTGAYEIAAALLDGAPDGVYGGSGLAPDPETALAMKAYHPLFLAGGLGPDTIAEAVRTVRPFAVDVNSGVESSPGTKDHAKVELLFERLGRTGTRTH